MLYMDWISEFNAIFFLSAGGVILAVCTLCFKSKCTRCSFCGPLGLLQITRNVDAENAESQFEITHSKPTQSDLNIV